MVDTFTFQTPVTFQFIWNRWAKWALKNEFIWKWRRILISSKLEIWITIEWIRIKPIEAVSCRTRLNLLLSEPKLLMNCRLIKPAEWWNNVAVFLPKMLASTDQSEQRCEQCGGGGRGGGYLLRLYNRIIDHLPLSRGHAWKCTYR